MCNLPSPNPPQVALLLQEGLVAQCSRYSYLRLQFSSSTSIIPSTSGRVDLGVVVRDEALLGRVVR